MTTEWWQNLQDSLCETTPRQGLHPIPGSKPLTLLAAILPPLLYFFALLLLAPSPPPIVDRLSVKVLRNILALTAGILFFRLPLVYHVPQSIGLTYQLGLVGLYGGCRVLDAFFISPYLFDHIPRRVKYHHRLRLERKESELQELAKQWTNGGISDPFQHAAKSSQHTIHTPKADDAPIPKNRSLQQGSASLTVSTIRAFRNSFSGPDPIPVYETALTETGWPTTLADRAAWALELELSMRGVGFTWTTADIRHTKKTWLPTVRNRIHSILVHVCPVLFVSWAMIRTIYSRYVLPLQDAPWETYSAYDLFDGRLPIIVQLQLTGALGAFLMGAFSFGHSLFAIILHPLRPSPFAFFPPLYTTRPWDVTSVRKFWSFGWHRLFARLFLVYGVWPGEWIERRLLGRSSDKPADIGKVLGAFLSSAFVHSFAVRGVLAGDWQMATGEAKFFALNGVAVVVEGAFVQIVEKRRQKRGIPGRMWYDSTVGRVWWMTIILWTGRNFARGWVKSSLVREMAFL
ncbi:uncharacterized protein PV06_10559 [Exophiala oligosperma]|uniref:Wax synthase domain-containing protein n=1 Tax=Exophiala oligosperma TaxID=215243 RepID=A0A0D2DN62_9EURO|nr:uncharacterized protein PV06_10559 [Exophiala oligosperma]KIW37209.1 hypothetical protein PV06_10559 [Exophiala oligosperma]